MSRASAPHFCDNDRLGTRTDLYGVSFEKEPIHTMSLCIALVDQADGVLAADGRLLRKGSVASEIVLKTMRLSDSLSIGFVGRMGEIQRVQEAFAPDYKWDDSIRFCQDWEDGDRTIKGGFRNTRDKVRRVIEKIRSEPLDEDDPGVGVLLLGRVRGQPILWGWDNDEDSKPLQYTWGLMAIGARPPDGSEELRQFAKIIGADESTKNAERRLASGIRYCASDLGYQAVNENVSTRRLSKKNAIAWDWAH